MYDSFLLLQHRKGFHCIRRTECLHLRGQRTFYLRHRPAVRELRLGLHPAVLACPCAGWYRTLPCGCTYVEAYFPQDLKTINATCWEFPLKKDASFIQQACIFYLTKFLCEVYIGTQRHFAHQILQFQFAFPAHSSIERNRIINFLFKHTVLYQSSNERFSVAGLIH